VLDTPGGEVLDTPRRGVGYPRRDVGYPRRGVGYPRRGVGYPRIGVGGVRRRQEMQNSQIAFLTRHYGRLCDHLLESHGAWSQCMLLYCVFYSALGMEYRTVYTKYTLL
jgi:hypothetical protein